MAFVRNSGGQVAVLTALLLSMLLGFAALAVDVSFFNYRKDQLQAAADAAALGASLDLTDLPAARTKASALAAKNLPSGSGDIVTAADIVFGVYDKTGKSFTPGNLNVNAVKVTANRTAARSNAESTFFGAVLGFSDVDIRASALAVGLGPGKCFFVLKPSGKDALQITGSGKVSVPNCGVQVNSTDSQALKISGGGTMDAKSTCVVGGASGGGVAPPPQTACASAPDPLASLPEPSAPSGPCLSVPAGSPVTVYPGKYCGSSFQLSGSRQVNMQPGLYYFQNTDVKISNSASISGPGVTFFFNKDSSIDISSSGTINLTAPTSGVYKGILFFHSRLASGPKAHDKFTGSSTMLLGGTLYLPTVFLEMAGTGNVSVKAKSGYVIAERYKYTGDIDFKFDAWGGPTPSALGISSTLIE